MTSKRPTPVLHSVLDKQALSTVRMSYGYTEVNFKPGPYHYNSNSWLPTDGKRVVKSGNAVAVTGGIFLFAGVLLFVGSRVIGNDSRSDTTQNYLGLVAGVLALVGGILFVVGAITSSVGKAVSSSEK